jgi:hypothetical protein
MSRSGLSTLAHTPDEGILDRGGGVKDCKEVLSMQLEFRKFLTHLIPIRGWGQRIKGFFVRNLPLPEVKVLTSYLCAWGLSLRGSRGFCRGSAYGSPHVSIWRWSAATSSAGSRHSKAVWGSSSVISRHATLKALKILPRIACVDRRAARQR